MRAGYRHFSSHPGIRDYLLFRYNVQCFLCISLPFFWGRSVFWFYDMITKIVKYLCDDVGVPVPSYNDYFLIASSVWSVNTGVDFVRVIAVVGNLYRKLGVKRHEGKFIWVRGPMGLDHLGVTWDSGVIDSTSTRRKSLKGKVTEKVSAE